MLQLRVLASVAVRTQDTGSGNVPGTQRAPGTRGFFLLPSLPHFTDGHVCSVAVTLPASLVGNEDQKDWPGPESIRRAGKKASWPIGPRGQGVPGIRPSR